jgi:hypothetical protein
MHTVAFRGRLPQAWRTRCACLSYHSPDPFLPTNRNSSQRLLRSPVHHAGGTREVQLNGAPQPQDGRLEKPVLSRSSATCRNLSSIRRPATSVLPLWYSVVRMAEPARLWRGGALWQGRPQAVRDEPLIMRPLPQERRRPLGTRDNCGNSRDSELTRERLELSDWGIPQLKRGFPECQKYE